MALNEIEIEIIKRKISIIDKLIWLRLKRLENSIENKHYYKEESNVIECFELYIYKIISFKFNNVFTVL